MSVACSRRIVYIYFVKTLEDEFWEMDGLMEELIDCFIISVGGTDTSEDGSDSEDSSPDSELEGPLSD